MRIFAWHVHGSWMTAFVQGAHTYYVPVDDARGPDGRGRAATWTWPESVIEVTADQAADLEVDVVVLQRPHELALVERWLGPAARRLPTVYVEHDVPLQLPEPRHPAADRDDLVLVHVTEFNRLMWDAGSTLTTVIEHGVVDPGERWTGELRRGVAAINEPVRRRWVTGLDLLQRVRAAAPVDLFGMAGEEVGAIDVPQHELHDEMARRRVYVHPFRWTSLGLALVEAMMLGMPVAALAATEVPRVLTPDVGILAHGADELVDGVCSLLADDGRAAEAGRAARALAVERFGLDRFLSDWDHLLGRMVP